MAGKPNPYLDNLQRELDRLQSKLKRMIDDSPERAVVEVHIAGVQKEIGRLTPTDQPSS